MVQCGTLTKEKSPKPLTMYETTKYSLLLTLKEKKYGDISKFPSLWKLTSWNSYINNLPSELNKSSYSQTTSRKLAETKF